MSARAVIAAGHPMTADAGARILRAGGNAVDAAVGAVLVGAAAEPLLTGLGAGGYLHVAGAGVEPTVLDFFVAAPGRGAEGREHAPLEAVDVDFGDAVQVFNVGPASVGVPGVPGGLAAALDRWGTVPLADLAAPAAALCREGVALNEQQAFIAMILRPIMLSTPECAALWAPGGRLLQEGDVMRNEELAASIELFGREGAAPFYEGDVARRAAEWVGERGGLLTTEDLRGYEVVPR